MNSLDFYSRPLHEQMTNPKIDHLENKDYKTYAASQWAYNSTLKVLAHDLILNTWIHINLNMPALTWMA